MTADNHGKEEEGYMSQEGLPFNEDEIVVADMSDLERQPLLVPRLDILYKRKRGDRPDSTDPGQLSRPPAQLDGEGRRAMIRGALAAVFLLVAILAGSFAGLIFLINALWG